MLPTPAEQYIKYQEIRSKYGSFFTCSAVAKEYAKWYATRVIEHCAEVALCDRDSYAIYGIDRESILNVINEL